MCQNKIFVNLKTCHPDAVIPKYATEGSSGLDLCAIEDMVLQPKVTTFVPTGIKVSLPEGYEAQIRSRSGFSSKNKVILSNGIGSVDRDFRGEIKVLMYNLQDKEVEIKKGQAIAQLVICPVVQAILNILPEDQELDSTSRGEGGFGSTDQPTS